MDVIYWIIAAVVIVGFVWAIHDWRKGSTIVEDCTPDGRPSKYERDRAGAHERIHGINR